MKALDSNASTQLGNGSRFATDRRTLLIGSGAMTMCAALPMVGCGASGGITPAGNTSNSNADDRNTREPPHPEALPAQVPKRPFGKTGVEVSELALGGYFDTVANQSLLHLALERGVSYWECASQWGGKGYGKYFEKHPEAREHVFLLAKTKGASLEQIENDLGGALAEMKTSYIDFFVLQSISDGSLFTADVRRWVETAKADGRIRFFGFTTHTNMEECLHQASLTDWIDGAVTTYNYRLMHLPAMKSAVDACATRGIALTAIKSQAMPTNPAATIGEETAVARQALDEFLNHTSDPFEARIQAVLSNPRISSVLSLMTDPEMLQRNATAVSSARGAPGAAASGRRQAGSQAGAPDGAGS